MVRRRKGFTLLEVLAAMAILMALITISLPSVRGMFSSLSDDADKTLLDGAKVEARRVAGLQGNFNKYPEGIHTYMTGLNLAYTDGASTGPGVLSVYRVNETEIVMALLSSQDVCFILYDQITAARSWWAQDANVAEGQCDATTAAVQRSSINGTRSAPTVLDIG